jgi:hypothetical protein
MIKLLSVDKSHIMCLYAKNHEIHLKKLLSATIEKWWKWKSQDSLKYRMENDKVVSCAVYFKDFIILGSVHILRFTLLNKRS